MKALLELLQGHKRTAAAGIYSVCSSHPLVIEAALREAHASGQYALIEATSNQVNQFGGYSGMQPVGFREYVSGIRARTDLPIDVARERIADAIRRLDDTIREIRDHVFAARGPGARPRHAPPNGAR